MSVEPQYPSPVPVTISVDCSATITRADGTTDNNDESTDNNDESED